MKSPMNNDAFLKLLNRDKVSIEFKKSLSSHQENFLYSKSKNELKVKSKKIGNQYRFQLPKNLNLKPGPAVSKILDFGSKNDNKPARLKTLKNYSNKNAPRTFHPKTSPSHQSKLLTRTDGSAVQPHIVFGTDDRVTFQPDGYPYHCIGKLIVWDDANNLSARRTGSAALVGENMILTASHMCPWDSKNAMIQFIPAYYDGDSYIEPGLNAYVTEYCGYNSRKQSKDMAIMRLNKNLGSTLGYFGLKQYNDDWRHGNYWTRVGYAGSVSNAQRPNKVSWFPVIDQDGIGKFKEIEYQSDASSGDSGGPVWGWWDGDPYIIGNHVGTSIDYHFPFSIKELNVATSGSGLLELVRFGRDNW